jgi:hypothetical protein
MLTCFIMPSVSLLFFFCLFSFHGTSCKIYFSFIPTY